MQLGFQRSEERQIGRRHLTPAPTHLTHVRQRFSYSMPKPWSHFACKSAELPKVHYLRSFLTCMHLTAGMHP